MLPIDLSWVFLRRSSSFLSSAQLSTIYAVPSFPLSLLRISRGSIRLPLSVLSVAALPSRALRHDRNSKARFTKEIRRIDNLRHSYSFPCRALSYLALVRPPLRLFSHSCPSNFHSSRDPLSPLTSSLSYLQTGGDSLIFVLSRIKIFI